MRLLRCSTAVCHNRLPSRCAHSSSKRRQIPPRLCGSKSRRDPHHDFQRKICVWSSNIDLDALGLDIPEIDNDLNSVQQELGAVFNDAGVVVNYKEDEDGLAEALRNGCVLVDRSHWGRLRVVGPDSRSFLHNQSTQNFNSLSPGQGCDTVFVTATARCLDLATALVGEGQVLLLVSPSQRQPLLDRMNKYIFPADKVQVQDISHKTAMFSLVGPKAEEILRDLGGDAVVVLGHPPGTHQLLSFKRGSAPIVLVAGSGLASPGYTLIVDEAIAADVFQALSKREVFLMGDAGWSRVRVLQGRPAVGAELTEEYNPLEAGLYHMVSLTKGCYIGQETLAKLSNLDGVKQQLWGLQLQGNCQPGDDITSNGERVGRVTSVTDIPGGGYFALGYLKCKSKGAQVKLEGISVEVNGTPAVVTALPFLTRSFPEGQGPVKDAELAGDGDLAARAEQARKEKEAKKAAEAAAREERVKVPAVGGGGPGWGHMRVMCMGVESGGRPHSRVLGDGTSAMASCGRGKGGEYVFYSGDDLRDDPDKSEKGRENQNSVECLAGGEVEKQQVDVGSGDDGRQVVSKQKQGMTADNTRGATMDDVGRRGESSAAAAQSGSVLFNDLGGGEDVDQVEVMTSLEVAASKSDTISSVGLQRAAEEVEQPGRGLTGPLEPDATLAMGPLSSCGGEDQTASDVATSNTNVVNAKESRDLEEPGTPSEKWAPRFQWLYNDSEGWHRTSSNPSEVVVSQETQRDSRREGGIGMDEEQKADLQVGAVGSAPGERAVTSKREEGVATASEAFGQQRVEGEPEVVQTSVVGPSDQEPGRMPRVGEEAQVSGRQSDMSEESEEVTATSRDQIVQNQVSEGMQATSADKTQWAESTTDDGNVLGQEPVAVSGSVQEGPVEDPVTAMQPEAREVENADGVVVVDVIQPERQDPLNVAILLPEGPTAPKAGAAGDLQMDLETGGVAAEDTGSADTLLADEISPSPDKVVPDAEPLVPVVGHGEQVSEEKVKEDQQELKSPDDRPKDDERSDDKERAVNRWRLVVDRTISPFRKHRVVDIERIQFDNRPEFLRKGGD